ncbi:DUF2336 domain-containing protein [Hwanghaeella sp.]|uniref:DUF2336 domain-containing protein n=1 Tax=Hwanghaeella sp. TaxID=2605943 RepID=UPI003CCBBFF5
MMPIQERLQEMQTLAMAKTRTARGQLGEHLTGLLQSQDAPPTEMEWELIAQIYELIVRDVETVVRSKFAEELARRLDAPRHLIVILGNDEIEIARPVLTRSTVLLDEDLIDIVTNRTTDHRSAVAIRARLSDAVSASIVDTGDVKALTTLLRNHTADISDKSFLKIADLCASTTDLHEPLVNRQDTPWPAIEKVVSLVSEALLVSISAKWSMSIDDLTEIAEKARDASLQEMSQRRRAHKPPAPPPDTESADGPAGRLEQQIINALRNGDVTTAQRLVEHWSQLPGAAVRTILLEDDPTLLATLYKAKGADPLTFSRTVAVLKGENFELDRTKFKEVLSLYRDLDARQAMRTVMHWRKSPRALLQKVKRSAAAASSQAS